MESGWNIDWRKSVIILSGGFDPIHKGHMRMFREAANLGHQVIVGLNSDEWLTRKKGKPFMEFYERKEILEGIKYISSVVKFDDRDDTANSLISQVRSTYNGGMFNHTFDDVNPTGRNDYQIYFANDVQPVFMNDFLSSKKRKNIKKSFLENSTLTLFVYINLIFLKFSLLLVLLCTC